MGTENALRAATETIRGGARALGLSLSEHQVELLGQYVELLGQWNKRTRLVADASPAVVGRKHVLDSLECLGAPCLRSARSVVDVGSGGGLPGIPLAIALQARVVLVESIGTKAEFLRAAKEALGLRNLDIVRERAEDVGRGPMREAFDCAVARALAALPVVLEYCLPLVRVGGSVVAQKGTLTPAELRGGEAAAGLLGGGGVEVLRLDRPSSDARRCLAVVRKIAPTPEEFPRRTGMPAKRPLGGRPKPG